MSRGVLAEKPTVHRVFLDGPMVRSLRKWRRVRVLRQPGAGHIRQGGNMRVIRLMSIAALALLLGASTARAQGHANVFIGSNFSGDAGRSLSEALNDGSRLTWGADIGGMTKGIFGAELDFSHSRNFFGNDPRLDGNYVFTLMPTLLVGVPVGGEKGPGIQPYGSAGFGWIRRNLEVDGIPAIKDNSLGYSL